MAHLAPVAGDGTTWLEPITDERYATAPDGVRD